MTDSPPDTCYWYCGNSLFLSISICFGFGFLLLLFDLFFIILNFIMLLFHSFICSQFLLLLLCACYIISLCSAIDFRPVHSSSFQFIFCVLASNRHISFGYFPFLVASSIIWCFSEIVCSWMNATPTETYKHMHAPDINGIRKLGFIMTRDHN